jgi:thiol-disulfide isomerase/thioredoxin
MKKIVSIEDFQKAKEGVKSVLLFSADWCPDCRFIEPFFPEVESNFSDFTFFYVDRDKFLDQCIELDVYGIPSFLIFNNGKEIGRFVNKDRKTREQIEAFLNQHNV